MFSNQKSFKMGVRSENFILTRKVEWGLMEEGKSFVYFDCTERRLLTLWDVAFFCSYKVINKALEL
ncbi:hypothetical protein CJ195_15265 [Bacillus sp. UMB0899]|nr:hypothetical protein CJ195_15265 [Bacillus sp. UMB0899]